MGEVEGLRARIIGDVLGVTNIAIGGRVYLAVRIGGHDGLQVRLDFGRDKWALRGGILGGRAGAFHSGFHLPALGRIGAVTNESRNARLHLYNTTPKLFSSFHYHDYHRDC